MDRFEKMNKKLFERKIIKEINEYNNPIDVYSIIEKEQEEEMYSGE